MTCLAFGSIPARLLFLLLIVTAVDSHRVTREMSGGR